MKWARTLAVSLLALTAAACVLADVIAPASYTHQFRAEPDAAPSRQHLLGTDDLGRDRFSRLLYGTRVSLLLAPAAALLSSLLAQFWISVPAFILTEANLGMLGLGVAEPLPSWGSLLREMQSYPSLAGNPWRFIPLLLFIVLVSCFQLVMVQEELPA